MPSSDYLKRLRKGDLDLEARREAIDWIGKVHANFNFGPLCTYLAVSYLDGFLSAYELPKGKAWMMQLLTVACLSIAAKKGETEVPLCLDLQVKGMIFLVNIGIDFLAFKSSKVAAAVTVSVAGDTQTLDTEKAISLLTHHVEKERVLKCVEMIHETSLIIASVPSVPLSPIGVLDAAACLSYKTHDTTVGSCPNSSQNSPDPQRRKLNRTYAADCGGVSIVKDGEKLKIDTCSDVSTVDDGRRVGIWLVGKPNDTVVWTANRDDPLVSSNSTLEFTTDGRLILYTDQGIEQSVAYTNDELAVSAAMLDTGNFVLYDNSSSSIWESFSFPTDTILGNQTLDRDSSLVSSVSSSDHSSGHFIISMQRDGNLVAYPVNSSLDPVDAYWASDTYDGFKLNLTVNGLLYLAGYTTNILTLVNGSSLAENNTIIYRATLDDDGILRLYSHSFESNRSSRVLMKWSLLQDDCQVHGVCGFNSYCSRNGTKTDCYCYPGFAVVDNGNKFLGCYRNFSEDPCRNENGWGISYNMTTLENVTWGDSSYFVASMEKEDCQKSCTEDCNCAAALFLNGNCRKHKLPLRYGTRDLSNLNTAFVKIGATIQDHIPNSPLGPSVVTDNKRGLISILALSLGSIACLCYVIAISSFFIYKRRVHRNNIVVNVSNADEIILSSWVYKCFDAGELYKLVGDENVASRTLQRMVKVGLWCIQDDPALRPSMKKVILMLEGTVDIPVPPNPSPVLLRS
ncbi:cyclin d4;2 [Actinidia rufa]|uniref:Cyclin d42 n=1 Tax=Actinidia rufa TaxID=165716 RepID=A0A7J0DWY9_9ERIC|nr:cyclin d4;2 [Actinidia rufa]